MFAYQVLYLPTERKLTTCARTSLAQLEGWLDVAVKDRTYCSTGSTQVICGEKLLVVHLQRNEMDW